MIELLQTSVWLLRHLTEPLPLVANWFSQKFISARERNIEAEIFLPASSSNNSEVETFIELKTN